MSNHIPTYNELVEQLAVMTGLRDDFKKQDKDFHDLYEKALAREAALVEALEDINCPVEDTQSLFMCREAAREALEANAKARGE